MVTIRLTDRDQEHVNRAIELAEQAGRAGNLPIGCVICLDDQIVAEAQNAIWQPKLALHRHAELEALRALPDDLMPRLHEMTLYTTLEPCLMCAGAILLHQVRRVIVGAADPYGGAGVSLERLPSYFAEQYALTSWIGPIGSEQCEALYRRITELERQRGA